MNRVGSVGFSWLKVFWVWGCGVLGDNSEPLNPKTLDPKPLNP